ncbi:MAG: Rrf2 family transcriptional regulator [Bacteroidetes bacterium]|nr:MAG: Rrf2 family transcriptional regulator [Bacteroidota bacterium]
MSKLINISEATSIAIHSLALIGYEDKQLNANEIAKRTSFSKNHLSKVLQTLVKQGYLRSVRGPRGGFTLSVEAKDITLLEIFEVFEGKILNNYCFGHFESCPFEDCIFGDIVDDVTVRFKAAFGERTIADVKMKEK